MIHCQRLEMTSLITAEGAVTHVVSLNTCFHEGLTTSSRSFRWQCYWQKKLSDIDVFTSYDTIIYKRKLYEDIRIERSNNDKKSYVCSILVLHIP